MFTRFASRWSFDRGTQSTPAFDGPLRPNQELDLCRLVGRELGPADDVAVLDGEPVVSAGDGVIRLTGHWFAPSQGVVATVGGTAGALAVLPDGGLAVAVLGRRVVQLGGAGHGRVFEEADGKSFVCVTALAVSGDRLLVAEGSATNGTEAWRRDLFEQNRTGRVVAIDLTTGGSRTLAEKLAWAGGVAGLGDGRVAIAESWAHRITVFSAEGRVENRCENLPAYPGRLVPDGAGGVWAACFAVRSQLVDFILADRRLATRMMQEVEEPFWIAPALAASDHLHEPTQLGGIKQYGAKKPWAPARSYGLVIRLDGNLAPLASLHSRVDGKRHGITGLATNGSRLFIASRGHGKLLLHEEAEGWTQ